MSLVASLSKIIVGIILVFTVLTAIPITHASAQCSVCAGQVQTSMHEGNGQAKGLNMGIVYLMTTPYLLVAGVGYVWYKNYRKKNILVDIRDEKIHLN